MPHETTKVLLVRLAVSSRELERAIECDRLQAVALCARDLHGALSEAAARELPLPAGSVENDAELRHLAAELRLELARAKQTLRLAVERLGVRRAGLARAGTGWYGGRPRAGGRQVRLDVGA